MTFNNRKNNSERKGTATLFRNSVFGKCLAAFLTALFAVCVVFACRTIFFTEKSHADSGNEISVLSSGETLPNDTASDNGGISLLADPLPQVVWYSFGTYEGGGTSFEGPWSQCCEQQDSKITLLADVEINTSSLSAVNGKVTLDLNGHTLNLNGNHYIPIFGELTLKDESTDDPDKFGKITGGTNGAVVVNGTFNMKGGKITGNTASGSGGGVSLYQGTFNMSGGIITGNTTTSDTPSNATGGGVHVNGGTFNMTGGEISDNTASGNGGGVYYSFRGGGFNLSGDPVIKNNTGNNGSNVYLDYDEINVTDKLSDGAEIGVTLADGTGTFTSDYGKYNSVSPSKYFTADNGQDVVCATVGSYIEAAIGTAVASVTAAGDVKYYDDIVTALSTACSLGTSDATRAKVTLLDDITVSAKITLQSGGFIKLDLNGKRLHSTNSEQHFIQTSINIVITDESEEQTGTLSGGYTAVFVTGGICFIEGGTITCASSRVGVQANDGTTYIKGGTITGNAYGIYMGIGNCYISGGTITGNTRAISLSGASPSKVHFSGNPVIKENTTNNVNFVMYIDNELTDGAEIYVSSVGVVTNGYKTHNGSTDPNTYFKASVSDKLVYLNDDGEVVIDDGVAQVTFDGATTKWGTIAEAFAEANKKDSSATNVATIQLLKSVTSSETLTVNVGKYIELNLNGNDIIKNGSSGVINVGGNFSLYGSGKITGGSSPTGGGVYVSSTGEFSISGSPVINDNTGSNVYLADGKTITIARQLNGADIGVTLGTSNGKGVFTSGYNQSAAPSDFFKSDKGYGVGLNKTDGQAIIGDFVAKVYLNHDSQTYDYEDINTAWADAIADSEGATIILVKDATVSEALSISSGNVTLDLNGNTLNLGGTHIEVTGGTLTVTDSGTDGTITGGSATNGGAIYVNGGTFSMTGGTISGNSVGVYVANGTFAISGNPKITGNTDGNVYLPEGKKITVNGALTSGASIGITLEDFTTNENGKGEIFTDGYKVGGNTANPSEFFFADEDGYTAMLENGEVYFTDGFVVVSVEGEDDKKYNTINEAFYYANGQTATVTLLTDLSVTNEWTTAGGAQGSKDLTTLTSGEVTLSLGGYTLDLDGTNIRINSGATLKLTGGTNGKITGGSVYVYGGTFEMSSGSIIGSATSGNGGGVRINDNGTFRMSGAAKISDIPARGVYVDRGTFEMSGGTISNNDGGVYLSGGTFTMSGGTISNNTVTSGSGGGVYMSAGTFTMSDTAKIIENTAQNHGGGVGLTSYQEIIFTMDGGTISGNIAKTGDGGGVWNGGSRFVLNDGEISDNTASDGGGVCMNGGQGWFTMNGGKIIGNTAGGKGGGVMVSWDNTPFVMTGGEISANNAANGGGVYYVGYYYIYGHSTPKFYVSGDSKIYNNTKSDKTTKDNAYLISGKYITIGKLDISYFQGRVVETFVNADLSDGAEIWVTLQDGMGVFTDTLLSIKDPYKYFISDNSGYAVILNGDNKAELTDAVVATVTVGEGDDKKVVSFGSLDDAWGYANKVDNCEIELLGDVTVTNNLTSNGKTFTLNLGGHTVTLNGGHFEFSGDVKVEIINGVITGNSAGVYDNGGAISVSGGKVTIDGVEITENTAAKFGGAIYVGGGEVVMAGGSIHGNSAANGGGVYVAKYGTFTMTGGEITENTATASGGGVYFLGKLQLGGTAKITDNKVEGKLNNVYSGNYNDEDARISIISQFEDGAQIGVSRWITAEDVKNAYWIHITSDFNESNVYSDDEKVGVIGYFTADTEGDEIRICEEDGCDCGEITLFIERYDVTVFEGLKLVDIGSGYTVGSEAKFEVYAILYNPTWTHLEDCRKEELLEEGYSLPSYNGNASKALWGGDNTVTVRYTRIDELGMPKEQTGTLEIKDVARNEVEIADFIWRLENSYNLITYDGYSNSVVRYRGGSEVTVEIFSQKYNDLIVKDYDEDQNQTGDEVGTYTTKVTLTFNGEDIQRDYQYVYRGLADSYGMTVEISEDGLTATVTKVWYIVQMPNGLLAEKPVQDVENVEFTNSSWTFGAEQTVNAPYLEHGDEGITEFTEENDKHYVSFTLVLDGNPIGETFYRWNFNEYINGSMPVGNYELHAKIETVTVGGIEYAGVDDISYTITVGAAALKVNDSAVKGEAFSYVYDGNLHLHDGKEITADLLTERQGVWADEKYDEYYDSDIEITYNLKLWNNNDFISVEEFENISVFYKPVNASVNVSDGKYVVYYQVTAKNYKPYGGDKNVYKFEVSITKKLLELETVDLLDGKFTYDGRTHSLYISGSLPEGVSVTYEGNGKIDAGEYTVTAQFSHINIQYFEKTATMTIVKKYMGALEGVKYGETSFPYDSYAHSIAVTEKPDGITVSYSENNSLTNVGSEDVIVHFEHKNYSYDDAVVTLTVTMSKGDLTDVVEFNGITCDYDGKSHSIAISGKLPDGVTAEYINNGKINAGEYTVTVQFISKNQWFDEMQAKLTINKAKWAGDWSVEFNDGTFIVDGEEHSIYITGSLPDGVTVTYDGNGQKAIADYEITASFWHMNYYFDDMHATMHIIPIPVVEEPLAHSLWWLWLLIGILLFLILVALILTILHKRGILHVFTWNNIIAVRTRASIDAAIAAVRANRVDATTDIQIDEEIFRNVPPKPTDPAKLKDYTAYLRLRDEALALEAKAQAIEKKADDKLEALNGEENPDKVEKINKLREKAAGIRARATEIKVAAMEKYKSFTQPSEPTETEVSDSESSETTETENSETEVTEETVEETEATEETEETTEQPENENSTEEDGEEPSEPEDNSDEN